MFKNIYMVFLVFLILFSLKVAANPVKISPGILILSGTVTGENNEGIPYAKVQLPQLKKQFYTDSKGKFNYSIPYNTFDEKNLAINLQVKHISYNTLDTTINLKLSGDSAILINAAFTLTISPFLADDVVVTGTRTFKNLGNLPIPTDVITEGDITKQGNLKLDQILSDQLGIPLSDKHGRGAQLQGLDPDYSLILLNGEPVIGRTGGILNYSRFSVGNIKRVEVVSGPASSLYGSNALAGVINILTEKPTEPIGVRASLRYGSYNLLDIVAQSELNTFNHKLAANLFANRYSADGYKVDQKSIGLTSPKVTSYTVSGDIYYNINSSSNLIFRGRYNIDNSENKFNVLTNNNIRLINSNIENIESNFSLNFEHKFTSYFDLSARLYNTSFSTHTSDSYESTGDFYNDYRFEQSTNKVEIQSNVTYSGEHRLTFGIGGNIDRVKALQIADGKQSSSQFYSYIQDDLNVFEDLNLITSLRFDDHTNYKSNFSPKLALSYKVFDDVIFSPGQNLTVIVRASIGNGFKAPNFEQLYLDWTNPLAGYTVFGSTFVRQGFDRLGREGQLSDTLFDPNTIETLKPETSWAFTFGFNIDFSNFFEIKANIFRNNVNDLIEFLPIARKTNGATLHTYTNLNRIYTQGVDLKLKSKFFDEFSLEFNYQLLLTADLDVLDKYKRGSVRYRDREGNEYQIGESRYGGLFNRPRHSGIIKLTYTNEEIGFTGSLRGLYQIKYGWSDINGSLYLDDDREYSPSSIIWNLTLTKNLFELFQLQLGIDNVLDYIDTRMMALSPGRTFYLNLIFNYNKYN